MTAGADEKKRREERLEAELRANIARRKQQARQRATKVERTDEGEARNGGAAPIPRGEPEKGS